MSHPFRCPACRHVLTKKYRRELSPSEWLKLQLAEWMKIAEERYQTNLALRAQLSAVIKKSTHPSKRKRKTWRVIRCWHCSEAISGKPFGNLGVHWHKACWKKHIAQRTP